ncbi:5'-deoxynucleotidase [Bacillota bacterium Meth-B3]|nr:5'-deoxynucleotidase [Christensenellaceae bacterium]MEA5065148.1 5'-deoxynucleotidase [Eubacteriales bacterium]MEA5069424.1 5'-deoxynucleotidase [Christensenellaceae bacterium]
MSNHFFAYMARMKLIKRWGLRRNTREENDQEHSLMVAMIAHALAVLRNTRYGGSIDPGEVVTLSIYHEAGEVITGDLAAPIKYFNPGIKRAFKDIERMASEQLLTYLPGDLRGAFEPLLFPDEGSEVWKLVKAADKISAYLKCLEELGYGNDEFVRAQKHLLEEIEATGLPEVSDFMREFTPSFLLSLDALN